MMRQLLVPFLIIMSLMLPGCHSNDESNSPTHVESSVMPKKMPDDFAFSVSYGVGSKNIIDTYKGTVVKDLIAAGTAEADVTFSKEEMETIYQRMLDIDVLGNKKFIDKTNCLREPHGDDYWDIRVNGSKKDIHISDEYCELTEDAKQFIELRNFIIDIVEGKEEYIALPATEGGYE